MTDAAPAIFVALEQSGFAAAIRQSLWLYPAANVGHIVSLTFFAGAVAVMDIRLLGGLGRPRPHACSHGHAALPLSRWRAWRSPAACCSRPRRAILRSIRRSS